MMASFFGNMWAVLLFFAVGFVGGWWLCAKRGGKV